MQVPVFRLLLVAVLYAGPLARCAEPANAPGDTATATIDPHLNPVEDDFLNRQARAVLAQVDAAIQSYPPQLPEPPVRRMALLALDGILHDVYAPRRPAVQEFLHARMAAAAHRIEGTRLAEGATVWKLYNHGFVVRTATVTVGFDLVRATFVEAPGFAIPDSLLRRIVDQCDALFISHFHWDHADQVVAQMFLDQGKPVVAPPQAWADKPIHGAITHLQREAHTVQTLPIQQGKLALQVVVYPGHQDMEMENNVSLIIAPEGLSFAQTGDQWEESDSAWIDSVAAHHRVDVLLPNCWTADIARVVKGFRPGLVITGHENEMGHSIDKRVPYWLTYERRSGSDSYAGNHTVGYDQPLVAMTWGEEFHYSPAAR